MPAYNNTERKLIIFWREVFFDTPAPALIIVGRKSIVENKNVFLSAGKHHYS